MLVELYENEYQYILNCFSELLPQYCEDIKNSLYIDNYSAKINLSTKAIYSIELNLKPKDIEFINELRNKLKNHKNLNEFELYDKYIDFFNFIHDFCVKLDENNKV